MPPSRTAALRFLLALLAFTLPALTLAATPQATLERLVGEVQAQARLAAKGARPTHLRALARRTLDRGIDFPRVTREVLGPAWRKASPGQRARLVAAFRTEALRGYLRALRHPGPGLKALLAQPAGELIAFRPVHPAPGQREATVQGFVHLPGGLPLPVEVAMNRHGGPWRIHDVTLLGLSVVGGWRAALAPLLAGGGAARLLNNLLGAPPPPRSF